MRRRVIVGGLALFAWLFVGGMSVYAVVLPSSANLQLWLDAGTGITQSTDRVSQWGDQSGRNHHLAQASDARQPLYVASAINGLPALRFNTDGRSNDAMISTTAFLDTRYHSVFAVVKPSENITYRDIVSTGGLSSGTLLMGRYATNNARAHYHDGDSLKSANVTASQSDLSPSLSYQEVNDSNLVSRWNGGAPAQTSVAAYGSRPTATRFVRLASRDDGHADHWRGDIAEVIIYDVALSAADRVFVENYLSGKYGFGTAGSQVWVGGGTNDNISTAANWNPAGAFVAGNQMVFTGSARTTPNVDAPTAVAGIAFQSQAASFTLGGSALTVGANSITNWSTNTQTINNALVLGTNQTWHTVGDLAVAGNVSGNYGIIKTGSGTLTLTGDNTYSGTTTINGTLQIGAGGATGTIGGGSIINNGALVINRSGDLVLAQVISGTGTLTKEGSGRLTLSGTNTFSGALTVLDGTLSVPTWNANNSNGPLGNSSTRVVLGGAGTTGTLEFTATGGGGTARRGLELAAGGTGMVHLAPATGTRSTNYIHIDGSNITGSGAFIVDTSYGTTQTSRFIIVGSTGITGPVTVNPYSELQSNLANDGTPFGTGTITVSANAILGVYNTSPTVTATLGGLAGSGILQATDSAGLKTFRIGSNSEDTHFSGVIRDGAANRTVAISKIGTGTLTLSGINSYTGDTRVENGTLSITSWSTNNSNGPLGNSSTSVVLGGAGTTGTFQYTGGNIGGGVNLRGIEVADGSTGVLHLLFSDTGTTYPPDEIYRDRYIHIDGNKISGSGALTIDTRSPNGQIGGRFIITNPGGTAFSGPLTVAPNSELQLSAPSDVAFAFDSGTVTVNAGGILNLWRTGDATVTLGGLAGDGLVRGDASGLKTYRIGSNGLDTEFTGAIVNGRGGATVALTKIGTGTLTLSGINTFTGVLSVEDGTLRIGTWNNNNTAGPLGQSANKVQLDGGTIQYTGGNVGPNKSLNVAGPGTIDVVQAGTVLNLGAAGSNSLTGSGDITKEGLGTLQLAQAVVAQGSWGGKLIINQGTVDFFGGGSMPIWSAGATPDAIRINDGATFALSYGGNSTIPTNGGFQLSGNATIFVNSHTHSYAGIIADKPGDTGNLIKTGAGTLVLSGNNTYSGTTTISSGTIQVGAGGTSGTLGQGNIINNGALVINRSGDVVLAQDISGSGTLTKEGSGTLTLAGATNYGGSTYINDGTVLGALNFRNHLYIKSGTVNANLSNTGYTSRRVWIGGDAGATVTLGGDNSYTFTDNYATIIGLGTNVAGTVKLDSSRALGVSTNRTHVYSGMLDFNGTVGLAQDRISLLGANAVLANSTGAASTNAAIYLGEGSWGAGGNISVADGASLTLGGVVTSSAPTHPNLNKLGPGTLILTNSANSYNGTTNINAGILGIAATGALPGWNAAGRYSVAPGAILAIDYTQFDASAVAMLSTGNFQSGSSIGRMFNTTPGSFTHGADMANAAHPGAPTALVKLGPNTLTLTGNSTYTGPTVVDAGTLLVNGSTHANSAVAVRPGATLGGTGTVGGPTTIQAGGKLATGNSIGTLNFGSPLTLDAGAVWDWEFIHKSPGNHDQAAGPQLVLPTAGAVTFNIHGLPGHSVFPGDKFTVFTGDVENFSPERVALVNHSKWTSWQMSTGGSLVLTADPTISLSTDVLNAGQANPGAWNTRGNGYSNAVGVELVRFVDRFSTSLDAVAYTQAGTDTIDVSGWVVTSGTGGQRGASQGLQVNGYSSSNTAHTNPGGANPQNLYLRGEPNEYNEGFGAHANWIVTFDLDVIRQEHFAGTRMPFQLTGEFGTWGGIGSTGVNDGVIQGAIFLDGVRIDDMDPSIANPQASIRNLEFDLTIYSGRYLTFGIFNDPNSTVWDDGVFKNVNLTMIPEPGTWLMLLAAGAAGLLAGWRRRR